jgi:hypothetical protein
MNRTLVFTGSLCMSLLTLAAERMLGIGWDYHPDSVTYATKSKEMAAGVLAGGYQDLINNGYYLFAALLDQNVTLITLANMVFFALTNCILYGVHREHSGRGFALFLLLALNPYRLHLSTTLLKDTLVILLLVFSARSALRYMMTLPLQLAVRLGTVFYSALWIRPRHLLPLAALAVLAFIWAGDDIRRVLLAANAEQMVFRGFDLVPTFQDLGLAGIGLRALLWPLLAWSGLFVVLSPAAEYLVVALGSFATQAYCVRVLGGPRLPVGVFVGLALLGVFVTGFTAYLRYAYPLLTVLPLLALARSSPIGDSRGS